MSLSHHCVDFESTTEKSCSCKTNSNHHLSTTMLVGMGMSTGSCKEPVQFLELLVCLPIDLVYRFHLHLLYNQLILVRVPEEEKGDAVYTTYMNILFIFIAQKHESLMVKLKLHPDLKEMHYAVNTTLMVYKHAKYLQ